MAPERYLPARVNQHVMIIRIDPKRASPFFVLHAINSDYNKQILLSIARAGGATREALTKEVMSGFSILVPPQNIQETFSSTSEETFAQQEVLAEQNEKLRRARDLLLPRLMDGRIAV